MLCFGVLCFPGAGAPGMFMGVTPNPCTQVTYSGRPEYVRVLHRAGLLQPLDTGAGYLSDGEVDQQRRPLTRVSSNYPVRTVPCTDVAHRG